MNDHNITRLVVGEIYTVNMGNPVGHQVTQNDVSNILRWDNGRWKTSETLSEKFKRQTSFGANVLTLPTARSGANTKPAFDRIAKLLGNRRAAWGAGLAAAFLVALGGFTVAIRYVKSSDEFGFVPARTQAETNRLDAAVKTVDVPFVRPADDRPLQPLEEQPVDQRAVTPAVPTVSPAGVVTPGQGAPKVQGMPSAQPSNTAPTGRNEPAKAPVQPAMILDADTPPAKHVQSAEPPKQPAAVPIQQKPAQTASPPAQTKPAQPSQPASGAQQPVKAATPVAAPAAAVPAQAAQPGQAKPAQEAAPAPRTSGGLVAVTPDGKIALFTNPSTRLPERFSVGDKLPSGETIKSIDKSGKVVTNAKEYKLE